MPRKPAAKLNQKEREKWFVSLFINKFGAEPSKIALAERRAALKPGTGHRILRRKKVQEEIKTKLEPVRLAQAVQQAVPIAQAALQKELKEKLADIRRLKIEDEVLDDRLMQIIIGLDLATHPQTVLKAITLANVVSGRLEAQNTRRIIPPEAATIEAPGTYQSLFNRLALAPSPQESQGKASSEVFDLIPRPKQPEVSPPMPAPGESIDETPTPVKTNSRVITVEVG